MKKILILIAILLCSCSQELVENDLLSINIIAPVDMDISHLSSHINDKFICGENIYLNLSLTEEDYETVKLNSDISVIEENQDRNLFAIYSEDLDDNLIDNLQYSYYTTKLGESLKTNGIGDNEIIVGVVDTGINSTHQELVEVYETGWSSFEKDVFGSYSLLDNLDNGFVQMNSGEIWDANPNEYHGTFVSGIIGATGNNGEGITGIMPSNIKIVSFKVFAYDSAGYQVTGSGSTWSIYKNLLTNLYGTNGTDGWKAINLPNQTLPLNMSFGGSNFSAFESEAISKLYAIGIFCISASGNSSTCEYSFPSSLPGVMSVASVNGNNDRSDFSTYNSGVDIAAPGEDIISLKDQGYYIASGTSFSAPAVTGLVASMLSFEPDMKISHIRQIIEDTAVDIGINGKDQYTGYGLIDINEALQFVKSYDSRNYISRYSAGLLTINSTASGEYVYIYDLDNNLESVSVTDSQGTAVFHNIEKKEYEVVCQAQRQNLIMTDENCVMTF